MPWKRKGKSIYKEMPDGSLKLKQTCDDIESAKSALRLLGGVTHGWNPTGKKGRKKS